MRNNSRPRECARFIAGCELVHKRQAVWISTSDVMLSRGVLVDPCLAANVSRLRNGGFACQTIAPTVGCIHTPVSNPEGHGADVIFRPELQTRHSVNNPEEATIFTASSHTGLRLSQYERRIRDFVSNSPLKSLWNLQGVPAGVVAKRAWKSILEDRIFGHAAELGFYFLFALFPTLFSASSILGLIARSASNIFDRLLHYLALVIPPEAFGIVQHTFNETTAHSTSGKITFGIIAAFWSASVGVSALQDTLNVVYKIEDSRSYIKARLEAIGLTILIMAIVTCCLGSMLCGDFLAAMARHRVQGGFLQAAAIAASRITGWSVATALLAAVFAVVYYWAPDFKTRCWHWLTPGGAIGIVAWLLASLGFRAYLYFFNSYSVTYGSLGAVIILLVWFYITGLMLLVGAEINSEIEAAAAEQQVNELPSSPYEPAGSESTGSGASAAAD
jgi:membrane protein